MQRQMTNTLTHQAIGLGMQSNSPSSRVNSMYQSGAEWVLNARVSATHEQVAQTPIAPALAASEFSLNPHLCPFGIDS